MSHKTIHCIICGYVQGVYFRLNTRSQARILGVTGWVRNCSDGKVELKATGSDEQLRQLIEWLPSGVPAANVEDISYKTISLESFSSFEVIASC